MNVPKSVSHLAVAAVLGGTASSASAQFLMIPDGGTDAITLHDATTGALVNSAFITDASSPTTYDFNLPIEAIQIGSEIWISDQIADSVFVFDLAGSYLAKVTGGMDNIRGIAHLNGTVYVSNSGSNNNAPGDAVVMIDVATRAITGSFTQAGMDPFDVTAFGGNLLVSDISSTGGQGLMLFQPGGIFISQIVTSDGISGIDFPQQASIKGSDGNILVSGFSPPDGLYEYDPSGVQLNYFDIAANRGAFELLNGSYIVTAGVGTTVFDPITGLSTIVGGADRYISPLNVPEPTSLALLGGVGLLLRRRK